MPTICAPKPQCGLALAAFLYLVPLPAAGATFSYSSLVSGPPPTLSAFVQSISNGTVTVNGVDTAQPTIPFQFSWGDGSSTSGFFPQQHSYLSASRNYVITIKATENNGTAQQTSIPVFFTPPSITEQAIAGVSFQIPSQPVQLQTHYAYPPPADVTFFSDSSFPQYSRAAVAYILAVGASIGEDFANNNVFLLNGLFTLDMLELTDFGGGVSFWYTTPLSVGFGPTILKAPIQWFNLFNEIGKDTTLNTPVSFPFGGNTDGNASEIYAETMGDIFSYATGYELINNASSYGIEGEVALDIGNSMLTGAANLKATFDAYVAAGAPFSSWNPYNGGLDPTLGTISALAWKFIEHAEQQGAGYRTPAKRLMQFLQMFNPSMLANYEPHNNTQAGATFRSTLMVTAMSYAFSQDLRSEFRSLNFPIDDPTYQQLYQMVSVPPSVTTVALPGGTVGSSYSATLAAGGGSAPYTHWTVSAGSLPPGLALNASTGVISGTPSTATGSPFSFSVTVTDNAGSTSTAQQLSISVSAAQTNGQRIITTVAGNGTAGFSGDGGQATAAALDGPFGVAVDGAGNLDIPDFRNHRIRQVSTSGVITTLAGNGTQGFSGDGGPATGASLSYPAGLAFDAAGSLYVADSGNHRIRKVSPRGIITTVAGSGAAGFSGDGGLATMAKLNNPTDVRFDEGGNLFVVDNSNQRVRKIDTAGIITTVAGNGSLGFSGDGGSAINAAFYNPEELAIDSAGNLYITDVTNNRIRQVSTSGIITTVVGNGSLSFSGDGGAATSAGIYNPRGVALDSAANLYISDYSDDHVREVNAAGTISTVAGNGTAGFSGDGGPATSGKLNNPGPITVDGQGNLYIADHHNNRIRKVTGTSQAQPVITAVLNGASYSALLAPGCWAVIYGSGLGTSSATAETMPLQTTLGGTSVTVGGVAAPLLYASPTQINVLIPFEVQLPLGGVGLATVPVVVSLGGASSTPYNIPINRDAPAIFTRNAQGTGLAHVFDSKFRPLNSVTPGEVVILYAAGLGPTNPPASSASGASPAVVLYRVVDEVDIYIGEQKVDPGNVEFAGLAPGFPGVYQLNVKIPPGLASDRVYIREGGWQSNVVQVGIAAGQNVANVTGFIQGIYPPASAPIGTSAALQAAEFKVSFTILPTAGPFSVAAVGEVGSSIVTIDPAAGTFTASVTVPTAGTVPGDFAGTELAPVYDYAGCSSIAVCLPFPGNTIPASRLDPLMVQAAARLPQPNASGPTASTGLFQASGSATAGLTFTIDGTDQSTVTFDIGAFGAWLGLPYGPFATHTSTLALYVDGTLVASTDVMYSLVHR